MKTTLSFLTISSLFVLASCGQTNQPIPEPNTPDTKTESPSEQTVVQPTNTPSPVDTPTPPTPVVASPEPQPTPTSEPKVFYHTDFSRDDGYWLIDTEVRDDSIGVSGLENGRMWIASTSPYGGYYILLKKSLNTFTSGNNFSFETKFKIMKAADEVDSTTTFGGIVWDEIYKNDIPQELKAFIINTETGQYSIYTSARTDTGKGVNIVDPTKSDAIRIGEADNVLRVDWQDGVISFFINGTKVHSMEYGHPVRMGIDIGALMGGGFDYVTITPLH